jgi:hypothetical protein
VIALLGTFVSAIALLGWIASRMEMQALVFPLLFRQSAFRPSSGERDE